MVHCLGGTRGGYSPVQSSNKFNMASPSVDFGSMDGVGLLLATQACMFLLLRNVVPAKQVASPLLLLLSAAPAWPLPLMLTAFLVLRNFVLPRVLHQDSAGSVSSSAIRLDFRSNSGSGYDWSKFRVVGSLASWAVLHNFLTKAVQSYFSNG